MVREDLATSRPSPSWTMKMNGAMRLRPPQLMPNLFRWYLPTEFSLMMNSRIPVDLTSASRGWRGSVVSQFQISLAGAVDPLDVRQAMAEHDVVESYEPEEDNYS